MRWGFVLVTAYNRRGRRLPLRAWLPRAAAGTHEQYVACTVAPELGSTMHCVAGDGVGILAGAVLARVLGLTRLSEIALEYASGFAFGWMVFQALFMREMAGGSYSRSLTSTFIPELLSMNLLMTGMVPTMMIPKTLLAGGPTQRRRRFGSVMSYGAAGGVHCRLSDELVARALPSEARHDDGAASRGDWESVNAVAREIQGATICGLARCNREDIELAGACPGRTRPATAFHVSWPPVRFTGSTSSTWRRRKSCARPSTVRIARELSDDVEFSPEDASRTELEFSHRLSRRDRGRCEHGEHPRHRRLHGAG